MSYFNAFESIVHPFRAEMASQGITPPDYIQEDGILHRFHLEGDKPSKLSGWYVLHADGVPAGAFGSWKHGSTYKWCAKSRSNMSNTEWKRQLQRIDDARRQFNEAKLLEQQQAAQIAVQRWNSYRDADHRHPYLTKKQILRYCARQSGNRLVLPIVNIDGRLQSLQYISADGAKYLLTGGAKKGNFIVVQGQLAKAVAILLCEGFATGATIAAAFPLACVITAIDAYNLKHVAIVIRKQLPKAKITIFADDDRNNPDNPGIIKATEAATAARAECVKPRWPDGAPSTLTDFNDLACWLAAVGMVK